MSVIRPVAGAIAVVAALGGTAAAQQRGGDAFFTDQAVSDEAATGTVYDGSLTSTTFYYREDGDPAPSPSGGGAEPFSASPVDRIFTDLRTQLDAKRIGGSRAYVRADFRARLNTTTYSTLSSATTDGSAETDVPYQSGTRFGNELDLRELYGKRDGKSVDISVGRQFSLELAATKFDGIKVEAGSTQRWRYIIFGGLYPSRVSRDLRDDYAYGDGDPATPGHQEGGALVLPVTGGTGMAYRFQGGYGSFGVVGILPLADDAVTNEAEKPRVFGTASGYWRASQNVDLYHYLVADATGASGAGLTNLTLGVNLQPTTSFRIFGNVTRVDTDTLNVVAQERLQDPDAMAEGIPNTTVQNNLEVQRIAQEAVRVGVSASFGPRVEVTTSGGVRRRGELIVEPVNGELDDPTDDIVFPQAQAADVSVGLVDRESIADMRLGLTGTASFGIGDEKLYRATSYVARAEGNKELADGRAELEINLTYLNSSDDNRGLACESDALLTCYGASSVQSVTAGLLLFWRFRPSWFAVASGSVGPQFSKSTSATAEIVDQPTILVSNVLLRLAYRF